MSELPSHRDTGPAGRTDPADRPAIGGWSRRRRALVIAAAFTVLVLVAVLHLTGVLGSEGH
jgi:hypothetical protein